MTQILHDCDGFIINLYIGEKIRKMKAITILTSMLLAAVFQTSAAADATRGTVPDDLDGKTGMLSARCVVQDSTGTIWFGTDKSLFSYDGYDVRSYPDGIGNIQVNSLAADGGYIYLGCNDGLLRYDIGNGTYSRVEYFDTDKVRALGIKERTIYVGAESGLYSIDLDAPNSSKSVSRITADEEMSILIAGDRLYVGGIENFGYVDLPSRIYHRIPVESILGSDDWKVVTSIYEADDSTIYFGTATSLLRFDPEGMGISRELKASVIKCICMDGDGRLIFGTDDGFNIRYPDDGTVSKVMDVTASACMKDRDGNLWFATDNGLAFLKGSSRLRSIDTEELPGSIVYTDLLRDSQGRLWASSAHGLMMFESSGDGNYTLSRHYEMGSGKFPIQHNRVKSIVEDRHDGSLYVASDGGCLVYNEKTGLFGINTVEGTNNWIYDIVVDGNNLWLASFEGLFCMNGCLVKEHYTTANGLSTNDISKIVKDRAGNIWMLTRDQNIYILDTKGKKLDRFRLEDHASSRFADCIAGDLEGSVWISVKNELLHIDRYDGSEPVSVFTLDSRKTLSSYSISDIRGKMWVCSTQGIFLIDKASGKISHINTRTPYVTAYYDEANGNVLLGGAGRIDRLGIDEVSTLAGDDGYPVSITSVTVNGDASTLIPASTVGTGALDLRSRENNLTITFSDYNYDKEFPHSFRYSLTRRHGRPVWHDVVSDNIITLTDIKPGRYSLQISSGSDTSETSEALSVRIRQPWYLSVWMILLYLAAIGTIGYWMFRFLTINKILSLEKEQKRVLLEQFREKESFFGNIAHEFKTPLSLIIAPLGKLINEGGDDADRPMLQMAYDNANKLSSLIHSTIDYYNENNTSASDLIRSKVEFVEFARTIFSSYKEGYPEDEFIFDSSDESMVADIDVVKMEAVLNNLMSNACKYTPSGGSVIMTLDRDAEGGKIIIKVSDTGIGIPQEELPMVFQRYFESSRSKSGNYDSTGIGLSLVKNHVESHGGSVGVESDDNGTTFTVVLPCAVEDGPLSMAEEGPAIPSTSSGKPLVVIVDDNVQICSFLSEILKDRYRCISSNNGKSGLKLCKDVVPDLIISDVMMPVMDGLEMCRLIRQYGPLSTIPIILLTAKGDSETEKKSIDLNIDAFVPKPFEFTTLAAKIDQLIGSRQRMEQKLRLEIISTPKDSRELSYDEKYLSNVTRIIEEHLDDSQLSVATLCETGGFSENQLYRKVKQLTGMSTVEYIRSIRLKKAAILLQNGNFTVSEVMYSVGFSNASYFTRAFSAAYGKTPSEYLKSYRKSAE